MSASEPGLEPITQRTKTMFTTYGHFAIGSDTPFHVEQGTESRAHSASGRSKLWRDHVASLGGSYEVRILGRFDTSAEAQMRERELIALHRPVIPASADADSRWGFPRRWKSESMV